MRNDASPITSGRAVLLGHLVVTTPVVVLIVGFAVIAARLTGLSWRLTLLVGIGGGWLWWSLAVPRWRRWAHARGAEPSELQRLAQRTGLVWREGSFMSRTEIRPKRGS
jgi:hypothetical protein